MSLMMTVTTTIIIIIIIQYTIFYMYLLDITFTLLIKIVRKKVFWVWDSEKKGSNTKNAGREKG